MDHINLKYYENRRIFDDGQKAFISTHKWNEGHIIPHKIEKMDSTDFSNIVAKP